MLSTVYKERESIELCIPVNKHCVQCNMTAREKLAYNYCNLLVNFATLTHSVSFKFTSRIQVYSFTKFSHICTEYIQCLYAVMHRSILSLSLCTLNTPCVHVISCNLMLLICCVVQNDRTPLFWASFRGHTEIVAMLLKFGADFNSCSTVSTSYFITPISAVSEYVDVHIYVNIDPCNPWCSHVQRGLLYLVCVSVCLLLLYYSCATGTKLAHE